ncbi:MAG: flagellin FliC [Magnetococcales bacterium]|nr:flagellin FliC [Magnetococcales bacterium]MBF0321811.1 flagellin FliC [Magnetococcales bacterium]
MALYINTNVTSLNAQRNLAKSTNTLGTTFKRLSSGLRINSAMDDAAGAAISQRVTAQIRGLNMAIRNANDGISLSQVAEGALDETTSALQRIRELAVQSANSTYNSTDRASLNKEVQQLLSDIQRIAVQSTFNRVGLLMGSYQNQQFQVGAYSGDVIRFSIDNATQTGLLSGGQRLGSTLFYLSYNTGGLGSLTVSTVAGANSALAMCDFALDQVNNIRANLGAVQSRFQSVIANLTNMVENTSAARSRIQDTDIAAETANLTKNAIMQQAATAVLAQANQQPQLALQLLGK